MKRVSTFIQVEGTRASRVPTARSRCAPRGAHWWRGNRACRPPPCMAALAPGRLRPPLPDFAIDPPRLPTTHAARRGNRRGREQRRVRGGRELVLGSPTQRRDRGGTDRQPSCGREPCGQDGAALGDGRAGAARHVGDARSTTARPPARAPRPPQPRPPQPRLPRPRLSQPRRRVFTNFILVRFTPTTTPPPSRPPRAGHQVSKLRDVIELVDATYIVMERVDGPELGDYIASFPEGRLPPSVACRYFCQMLSALR